MIDRMFTPRASQRACGQPTNKKFAHPPSNPMVSDHLGRESLIDSALPRRILAAFISGPPTI